MTRLNRRRFLSTTGGVLLSGGLATTRLSSTGCASVADTTTRTQLGLVTYNWGKDWDLPTVIANCEATGFEGVELRSTHKHGVEITLSANQRKEVARRFADTKVELVGLGSACEYQSTDPAVLKKNIAETKAFVRLCHDLGGGGVKVRPNGLPVDVPVEQTLEQIGLALQEVAQFGADYGVALRLEVHGDGTKLLPNTKTILDVADHPNAYVCWNCNPTDVDGEGLDHNFQLVGDRINTVHIHDLRPNNYPWEQLFGLLKGQKFAGWMLLEEGKIDEDILGAMRENRVIWERLVAEA